MKNIWKSIKSCIVKIYHWAFPVHELFRTQKNTISALIQKYNTIDYTKTVAVEESMGEYTRGLLSLLMESKTFNFIFLTYLKNLIYPGIQDVLAS